MKFVKLSEWSNGKQPTAVQVYFLPEIYKLIISLPVDCSIKLCSDNIMTEFNISRKQFFVKFEKELIVWSSPFVAK